MMKILLVYPEDVTSAFKFMPIPPMGLMYLAANLESEGHDVKILDLNVDRKTNFDSLIRQVDLLGVGFTSQLYHEAAQLIKYARGLSPNTKIVVGGPHVTIFERKIFEQIPEIDYAVIGEGEQTMLELANSTDAKKIKGLLWKDSQGEIHTNRPRALVENLDKLGFPARHLISMRRYSFGGTILTSRGCPFRCIYCFKLDGRRYRAHSPEYVLNEMERLQVDFKRRKFYILDDNFIADFNRTNMIAEGIIKKKWKIEIILYNGIRVDSIAKNEALISKLARAGLRFASIGVESCIQEVLDATKKDITVEQIEKAIAILRRYGIDFIVFLMVGLPKDKLENVEKIKEWLRKNNIKKFSPGLATPYPKTELWDYIDGQGHWLKQPGDGSTSYAGHKFNVYPVYDTPDFSAEDRMMAIFELTSFSSKQASLFSYDRLLSAVKNPKLLYHWVKNRMKLQQAARRQGR